MSAGQWTFSVDQGATWQVTLTVKDDSGAVVDLTSYTARLQMREHVDSPQPVLSLNSSPGGGITIDGPAGQISWEVADDVTATWGWRHAVHNVEIEDAAGRTRRLLKGEVLIDPEVVR